jgi:transcriptional regulator with XRE-family HTH domain
MSDGFPQILSRLRKERRLNQRTAASALHISQALLSHYENGLREPGLGFVDAACRYYGVSADYLLGRSPVRTSFAEENASPALRRMTETGAQALLALCRALQEAPEEQREKAERLLQLSAYQMLQPLEERESPGDTAALCAAAIRLTQDGLRREGGEGPLFAVPEELRKQAEEELARMRQLWSSNQEVKP